MKVLIAILSCHRNTDKRAAIRETWLRRVDADMHAVFLVGRPVDRVTESDVVAIDVDDGYGWLTRKVQGFMRLAVERYEFDWMLKCDDDTYVLPGRVRSLITPGIDAIGSSRFFYDRRYYSGGAGYLLRRPLVEQIARGPDLPCRAEVAGAAEDKTITRGLIQSRWCCVCTSRLHTRFADDAPKPDNDSVTAHYCDPRRMRILDRRFGSP